MGPGRVVCVSSSIVAWIASPLTQSDEEIFGHPIGAAEGQQVWEALVFLVAARAWSSTVFRDAVWEIMSDSVSALTMVPQVKARGASAIVARESALILANQTIWPRFIDHLPGKANIIPDLLSRKFQPGEDFRLPTVLQAIPETVVEARGRAYYRTLSQPKLDCSDLPLRSGQ